MKNKKLIITIMSTAFTFLLVFVVFNIANADDNTPVATVNSTAPITTTNVTGHQLFTGENDSEGDSNRGNSNNNDNQIEIPEKEMGDRVNSGGLNEDNKKGEDSSKSEDSKKIDNKF